MLERTERAIGLVILCVRCVCLYYSERETQRDKRFGGGLRGLVEAQPVMLFSPYWSIVHAGGAKHAFVLRCRSGRVRSWTRGGWGAARGFRYGNDLSVVYGEGRQVEGACICPARLCSLALCLY